MSNNTPFFVLLGDRYHIPLMQQNVVSVGPGSEVVEGAIAVVTVALPLVADFGRQRGDDAKVGRHGLKVLGFR